MTGNEKLKLLRAVVEEAFDLEPKDGNEGYWKAVVGTVDAILEYGKERDEK